MGSLDGNEAGTRVGRPWCFFRAGGGGYAVGLDTVSEVIEVERLVALPLCPPQILGLCTFRREVVPVVGLFESGQARDERERRLLLILRSTQGFWSLPISPDGTVVGVAPVEGPAPAGLGGDGGPVYLGMVRHGDVTASAIDPEATWRKVRSRIEAWYADDWCRGAARRGEGEGEMHADRSAAATVVGRGRT